MRSSALRMIALGRFSDEDIAGILDMPLDEVKALHGSAGRGPSAA